MGNLQDPISQLHVYLVDSEYKGRAFSVPSQPEIVVGSLYEMSQWCFPLKAAQQKTVQDPVTQERRNNIVASAPTRTLAVSFTWGWYRNFISIPYGGCATCNSPFPVVIKCKSSPAAVNSLDIPRVQRQEIIFKSKSF